jgi:hypothetical protein
MAESRQQESWNHTSALLAMLVNVNRDPKKGRAAKPADFHPMVLARRDKAVPLKGSIKMLKSVFVDGMGKKA